MLIGLFDAFKRLDGFRPGDLSGFSGPNTDLANAQRVRFDALASEGSAIAVVFASRQLDEQQAVAAKGKLGIDRRPWYRVGLVAAADLGQVPSAVLAQRQLLIDTARSTHKQLRPLTDLALSWGALADVEKAAGPLSLGSFRCSSCGHQNGAEAVGCANCAAPRDEYSPRGVLSRVVRTRGGRPPCPREECGFSSEL